MPDNRFPWNENTSGDIAGQTNPRYETPLGAQQKANAARATAIEAAALALAFHKSRGDDEHPVATISDSGFMSAEDKYKADTSTAFAQENQNAFSGVNDVVATTKTDKFFLVGGVGITVTTDPDTKSVRITATGESTPGPHAESHLTDGSDPIPIATTMVDGLASKDLVVEVSDLNTFISAQPKNVLHYGADPTGQNDSWSAINQALGIEKVVFLPPGTYKVSDTLTIQGSGKRLIGSGAFSTKLISTNANKPVIKIATGHFNIEVSDMTIDRSVTAQLGGNGIEDSGVSSYHKIKNIEIRNQYQGLVLGPTDYGEVSNCMILNGYGDGVEMFNTTQFSACQWQISKMLCSFNSGRGFFVHTTTGSGHMSIGKWSEINTFSNSQQGISVVGTSAAAVNSFRLCGSFLGADGASELFLNTFGGNHQITDTFFEQAGTQMTGRQLTTLPSNLGSGLEVSANNGDVLVNSSHFSANANNGVTVNGGSTSCIGCSATKNGVANTQSYRNGFAQYAGKLLVSGCVSSANQFGLLAIDGSKITVNGSDLTGNTSSSVYYDSNATQVISSGNRI